MTTETKAQPVLFYGSPTLRKLPAERRPSQFTVCSQCTNGVWIATPETLKCYCRALFQMSWTDDEPVPIELCDAMEIPDPGNPSE